MKTAIIMAPGITQIMLSPENELERRALALITPDQELSVEVDVRRGTMFDDPVPKSTLGYTVQECRDEYLRAYRQAEAVMLVLRAKGDAEVQG
jgi:hypothetical protein